jgi:asparagine synthetase B (glutamine-hydrolysing)
MTIEQISRPSIANFIWSEGRFATNIEFAAPAGRTDALAAVRGQFAVVGNGQGGELILARDALGVNKLFFGLKSDGTFDWSNYWFELLDRGFAPEQIWSLPSGHYAVLDCARRKLDLTRFADLLFNDADHFSQDEIAAQADRVRKRLGRVFEQLRPLAAGRKLYVTLSGGLDSSTIAVLAREIIGEFTAVTFCVRPNGRNFRPSDDFAMASRLAADLGVTFLPVVVSEDELIESLDIVLRYGQDWRDFNVHCGLVNAAIGQAISRDRRADGEPGARPLLLTGDVMNELMADYETVHYDGKDYYKLPRLPMPKLRRWLLSGLDSGDREVGVFRHYGIDVLQPYALCARDYVGVPASLLALPKAKQGFVKQVMGDRIPAYIYDRRKVRAQVGSENEVDGTLAVMIRHGIDSHRLMMRFAELFSVDASYLNKFLRAGFYRFTSQYPG